MLEEDTEGSQTVLAPRRPHLLLAGELPADSCPFGNSNGKLLFTRQHDGGQLFAGELKHETRNVILGIWRKGAQRLDGCVEKF